MWGVAKPLSAAAENRLFQISLNERSLARSLSSGGLDHLDLAKTARTRFDIAAIEYVSRFFRDRVHEAKYLMEMNRRAADHDVRQLLIVVDGEGRLDYSEAELRQQAVRNHHKWIDAAKVLGCHSIEVDTGSMRVPEERLAYLIEAVRAVCEYAEPHHINVLVGCRNEEAADAGWLLRVIQQVDHPACGALPSLAGLLSSKSEDVARLIPLAKGICATARDFDAHGRETHVDFFRVLPAVLAGGYRGYVGIVYQGERRDEMEGILATKLLLEAVRSAEKPPR